MREKNGKIVKLSNIYLRTAKEQLLLGFFGGMSAENFSIASHSHPLILRQWNFKLRTVEDVHFSWLGCFGIARKNL